MIKNISLYGCGRGKPVGKPKPKPIIKPKTK